MRPNGSNHFPKPEPVWVVLGIVVWAVAVALGPKRRRVFIDTLDELTAEHAARGRVVAFGTHSARSRALSSSARTGAAYLQRLIAALRTALG